MIVIPELTPEILAGMAREFRGCDFGDEHQRAFLSAADSCDVQAAPGNGKTTLLAAKLALLARGWKSRTQGVCVISHTNAAREEVERKLASHPTASAFLGYPHFIGTVTAFIDRFIAIPYMRGLGWPINRIDDDVFAARARMRLHAKPTLRASAQGARSNQVQTWISGLEIDPGFDCQCGILPARLKVRNRGNRQPASNTASGVELEEIKAELVAAGIYRFADMTAIALRALQQCPRIVDRLRRRFPLVMLDEAQDTNGPQLQLLEQLFGASIAFQRLGDQNQTLYEDPRIPAGGYWAPNGVIPLDRSRRFGTEIAEFISRLTVRSPQQIIGVEGQLSRRALLLFDRPSILRVIPEFASQVRAHYGDRLGAELDIWAVASRHKSYQPRGSWPKSLVDYYPDYRPGTDGRRQPEKFCAAMRHASVLNEGCKSPNEILEFVSAALVELISQAALNGGERIGPRHIWRWLAARNSSLPLKIRRLVRDRILLTRGAWSEEEWRTFCVDLQALLGIDQPPSEQVQSYLEFNGQGAQAELALGENSPRTYVRDGDVHIKLGSIHSVKGHTVDAILVVETEIWRGPAREEQVMDLSTVLPHSFGIENVIFNDSPARLSAATNVFVGASRPREVLCFALRKESSSPELLAAAAARGWIARDLTPAAN